MFDVGFQELVLIGVVALLVVGPARLPRLARTVGLWLGRGRRVLASVKAEIDRELKADELREILRKQAASNPLQSILEEPASPASRPLAGAGGGNTDAPLTAVPAQSSSAQSFPAQSSPDPEGARAAGQPVPQAGTGSGPGKGL